MRHVAMSMLVLTVAVAPGCKKKAPASVEPPSMGAELRLQVTSIDPGSIAPNTAVAGTLFGSAFTEGARVDFVGPTTVAATDIRVTSSNSLSLTIPALGLGSWDVVVTLPDGSTAALRTGLAVKVMDMACRSVRVGFGFDSSSLDGGAKSTLDANMGCFQQVSGQIRIEGHCDERGTTDYNLALGQRRADTVRGYLVNGGVATSRVSATSYGEERPLSTGDGEAAWAQNRRAEILAGE